MDVEELFTSKHIQNNITSLAMTLDACWVNTFSLVKWNPYNNVWQRKRPRGISTFCKQYICTPRRKKFKNLSSTCRFILSLCRKGTLHLMSDGEPMGKRLLKRMCLNLHLKISHCERKHENHSPLILKRWLPLLRLLFIYISVCVCLFVLITAGERATGLKTRKASHFLRRGPHFIIPTGYFSLSLCARECCVRRQVNAYFSSHVDDIGIIMCRLYFQLVN